MDRRGFFRRIAQNVVVAAAAVYAPRLLELPTEPAQKMTLLDAARQADPDGSMARFAELLAQTNELVHDMAFVEVPYGPHRARIDTPLPSLYP